MELPPPRYGNHNGNADLLAGAKYPALGNPYLPYIKQLMEKKETKWLLVATTEPDECIKAFTGVSEFGIWSENPVEEAYKLGDADGYERCLEYYDLNK